MDRPIFNDPDVQSHFDEKGWVIVDFLDEGRITDLLNYYQQNLPDSNNTSGFHVSLDDSDPIKVKTVSDMIKTVMSDGLEAHFDKCKIFTSSYVIKEPGPQFIVPPHQDWSFTDESKFCSLTVWTPLLDVNVNNGGLGVIDGSKNFFDHPRSSPSPQSRSPLTDHVFTLFPYINVKELKAGQALIFDNRTIHASPPNMSNVARVGVGIGVMAQEAPLLHYYQDPNSADEELLVYKVDPRFYCNYNNSKLADRFNSNSTLEELELIGKRKRHLPILNKEEMEKLVLAIDSNAYQTDLVEKLKHLYPQSSKPSEQTATELVVETGQSNMPQPDNRTFFEKYTPANILAEIRHRLAS